jgi:DNA-directed RNA polymerase subunit RPC12/RpoP
MQFTCPDCHSHILEEISTNVTVASQIINISEDCLDYGEQTNEDGELERYQCANCGYILPVFTHQELIEWIKNNEVPIVPIGDIVGKTIAKIEHTHVDGNYGKEPCIMLFFTDGTRHGFVIAQD